MKNLIKLFTFVFLLGFINNTAYSNPIDKVINNSRINRDAISVSVKDVNTGKIVYKLNDKQSSIPASTLKLITYSAAKDTLGATYNFSTKLYKNNNNELFLILGADPFLKTSDLNKLFKLAKESGIDEPENIYIDDSIIDNIEWGEGWQWDDNLNPLMPRFSAYNIDKNLLEIIVLATKTDEPALIKTGKHYPITFMNLVNTGADNNIKISSNNIALPNIIKVEGTIKNKYSTEIPIPNVRRYFSFRVEDALKVSKIAYYGKLNNKKFDTENLILIGEIKHPIELTPKEILHNSNNMVAESLFKIAGSKFKNETGTQENSVLMAYAYLDKLNINRDDIRITDGSGVSKNNIITTDFMTEFLLKKASDTAFIQSISTPGEGTLKNRMLYFKDNLHAKTGTLANVSSIAGYINSRNGNIYVFDIIINDSKTKENEKKLLEEYILREIYTIK